MLKTDELEAKIGSYYKNVPHLPKEAREWLADNIWWLALIGAALCVMGLRVVIPALLIATGITASAYNVYANGVVGWLGLVLSLVGYLITTGLLVAAVKPLKAKSKKGWTYVFWSLLINLALNFINALVALYFISMLASIVYAAIGAYFLYEIRSYFGVHYRVTHKTAKKV